MIYACKLHVSCLQTIGQYLQTVHMLIDIMHMYYIPLASLVAVENNYIYIIMYMPQSAKEKATKHCKVKREIMI